MKNIICCLLLAFPITGICQQKYKVNGVIGGHSDQAKVYLVYREGNNFITDSCQLRKGAFEFSGVLDEPKAATLLLRRDGKFVTSGEPDIQSIYLDNGAVRIESRDSIAKAKVWGTPLNLENQEKLRLMHALKGREARDEAKAMVTFVQQYPASRVSLDWLAELGGKNELVVENFHKLSKELKKTKTGRELEFAVKTTLSLRSGKIAPDFALADQNGRMVKLSDFRGKYVLLDFWASWCKPCRAAQPMFKAVHDALSPTGKFVILSVSLDKKKNEWLKAVEEDGLPWTQLADLNAPMNKACVLYNVTMIPTCFLIGPDGTILPAEAKEKLMRDKMLPTTGGELDTLDIGRLSTLNKGAMRAAFEKENLEDADFDKDYLKLDSILETDIGERALAGELAKLDYKKDSAIFFRLFHTKSVALTRGKRKMEQDFIAGHPDSFVSLYQLNELEYMYTADGYIAAFNALSNRLKKTSLGIRLKERLEKYSNTPTGKTAADFSRKNHLGKRIKLSDYRGKVVLLDFWGSWCVPCRQSHPHLKELYTQYKSKGLEIVAVANEKKSANAEDAKRAWLAAIKKDDINWVHVLNTETRSTQDIAKDYGIASYPTKLLLDKDGKILMRVTGAMNEEMDLMIKKLLDK